jgi:broad specificity phosphatase PhoE
MQSGKVSIYISLLFPLPSDRPIELTHPQENQAKPCDTGTPVNLLAAEFPTIDFSQLDPVYPDKTSLAGAFYAYRRDAILARGQAALADLYARSEDVIAVVSHSGFMRTAVAGRWFQNADYRIFDFEDRTGKDEKEPYRLVEWDLTKKNGGMGMSWEEPVALGSGLPE